MAAAAEQAASWTGEHAGFPSRALVRQFGSWKLNTVTPGTVRLTPTNISAEGT